MTSPLFEWSPRKLLQQLDIFISSPGDVQDERYIALRVIRRLNNLQYIAQHYHLKALAYEETVPAIVGQRPQAIVDHYMLQAGKADIFICILWHRLGTPVVHEATGEHFQSGTEYEFFDAYRINQRTGTPHILLYRCLRPIPPDSDTEQFQRVEAFFQHFEGEHAQLKGLYKCHRSLEEFEEMLFHDLETLITRHLLSPSPGENEAPMPAVPRFLHEDWGEAPTVKLFYGRTQELATLWQWIVTERCHLVTIHGLGGIGKTTLAAYMTRQAHTSFAYVFWRSLYNAPPLEDILRNCILFLSDQQCADIPKSVNEQILLLIDYLCQQRCLLILDNIESILQEGSNSGQYREGYENYGQLLRAVGEAQHQSCLMITSRELPREVVRLESQVAPVRVLHLHGLQPDEGLHILLNKGLSNPDENWTRLIDLYAGNPLALTLVSGTIRDVFQGSVSSFLKEGAILVDSTNNLLEEQFRRLSALEQEIMYWLALEREPVALDDLRAQVVKSSSRQKMVTALESLVQRSMIITSNTGRFTLQPMIMEFVTGRFITHICEEFSSETLKLLNSHALTRAEASSYVRAAQLRLLLTPVKEGLLENIDEQTLEQKLGVLLTQAQRLPAHQSGYAAANILHLLIQLQYDLSRYDFSRLPIRQAYLQGVLLQDANFSNARFVHTLFTDTFGNIRKVAVNPAASALAAASVNGEVRLWSFPDGTPLLTYRGHINEVWSVAFNADGALLASGSGDRTIHVWEAATGRCLHILRAHTEPVVCIAFAPNAPLLASAGYDNMVHLWDTRSGQLVRTLERHGSWVPAVTFSRDGSLLATCCLDQTVKIWEVHTGQRLKTMQIENTGYWSVAINPAGTLVASGTNDGLIHIWDIATEQFVRMLTGHTTRVWSLAFSPDGTLLMGSGGVDIRLWDVQTGQCLRTLQGHQREIHSIALLSDGKQLISGGMDQTLCLWDVQSGNHLRTIQGYEQPVRCVRWNRTGTLVASSEDLVIRLWDGQSGTCLRTLRGHTHWVQCVAFSPDGTLLASGGDDQTVRIWEVSTGRCLRVLRGHMGWIATVVFNHDGTLLASGGAHRSLRIWDTASGRCLHALDGYESATGSVCFNPDGSVLASGGHDHYDALKLWDPITGQQLAAFRGQIGYSNIAYSPDGTLLVTSGRDDTALAWDVQTSQCIHTFRGHTNSVTCIAIHPLGQLLASGSKDLTIRLWDLTSGTCQRILRGHTYTVTALDFSPDGHILISSSIDGTVKYWDIAKGTCARTLVSDRPYERMNITGAQGLTDAHKETLKTLGAIENATE